MGLRDTYAYAISTAKGKFQGSPGIRKCKAVIIVIILVGQLIENIHSFGGFQFGSKQGFKTIFYISLGVRLTYKKQKT